eukprot:jgi/Mesvir1/8834/Mv02733-RA.1
MAEQNGAGKPLALGRPKGLGKLSQMEAEILERSEAVERHAAAMLETATVVMKEVREKMDRPIVPEPVASLDDRLRVGSSGGQAGTSGPSVPGGSSARRISLSEAGPSESGTVGMADGPISWRGRGDDAGGAAELAPPGMYGGLSGRPGSQPRGSAGPSSSSSADVSVEERAGSNGARPGSQEGVGSRAQSRPGRSRPTSGVQSTAQAGISAASGGPGPEAVVTGTPQRPISATRPASGARHTPPPQGTVSLARPPPLEDLPDEEIEVPGNLEATLRLHKARLRVMQERLDAVYEELDGKEQKLTAANRELRDLLQEKAAWQKTEKALEAKLEKQKRLLDAVRSQAGDKDEKLSDLTKTVDRVQQSQKQSELDAKAREVRLNRALEEVERYKKIMEQAANSEKHAKDAAKKDYERLLADNKRLERQKAELIAAFKKQLRLIDVLKRQKIHMEAARMLTFTEEEFLKTLELGEKL